MKKLFFPFLFLFSNTMYCQTNECYLKSYEYINRILNNEAPLKFKEAVLSTENSFYNDTLKKKEIVNGIEMLTHFINSMPDNNLLDYKEKDKKIVSIHAKLFTFMSDTIFMQLNNPNQMIVHSPYSYDFNDMWGEKDWTKMFVSKLLETDKGNCHSLPYLYKILADELGVPAYLAFAPNHIYIKSYSEKTGWYNTELTSGTFPIDAWIMASGYVTVESIQNGLYMDTLSNKQAVANCLVDLAQGYQRKFGKENPDFVIKCCNTCLKYHPVNVNAMLTKAEAQKYYIQKQMEAKKMKKPQDLFSDTNIKEMYNDMELTYVKLHQLGYRRMPEEMYLQWMNMLKITPGKYTNDKVSGKTKKTGNN